MNQTNTNPPNFRLLQSLATAKLSAIDALLKRLADPKLTPKQLRTLGCTLLRIPSLRPPRVKPSPHGHKSTRSTPSKPTPIPAALAAFITFANHFNHRLAEAKLAVQTLFLKLMNNPTTPEPELDRMTSAILRCPLPLIATLTPASQSPAESTPSPSATTPPIPSSQATPVLATAPQVLTPSPHIATHPPQSSAA